MKNAAAKIGTQREQVHETVAGRHKHRHVAESVAVDAPYQGRPDLDAGRDANHDPHLAPLAGGRESGGENQDDPGTRTEQILLSDAARMDVEPERQRDQAEQEYLVGVRSDS